MRALQQHLALKNPRFVCQDVSEGRELIVSLTSSLGAPATDSELEELRSFAGSEYVFLEPLYKQFNGVSLHGHGGTFGLVVAPIDELANMALDWREWFFDDEAELYDFQREGVTFATIFQSANYFVCHQGKVYYSDHDGGDDAIWGIDLETFFARALTDPAKFLLDAGCYTRYSDGLTELQYVPEHFQHD